MSTQKIITATESQIKKKYNYTQKAGRPLKTVKDCMPVNWKDIILEMSAMGCSEVEIRAKLCLLGGKFNYDTWYALQKREPEFYETIQIGKALCQAWWEAMARENLMHGKDTVFETGSWYANMKNRFGWRDKTEVSGNMSFTLRDAVTTTENNRITSHV